MKKSILVEYDREFLGEKVFASKIRPATEEEIFSAKAAFASGVSCDHSIVENTCGWLYDERICLICGKHMGYA